MNFNSFVESLGGRKAFAFFLTIGIGTAVELSKPGGLSEIFAGFLVFSAGAYCATNAALTWKGMTVQSADQAAPAAEPTPIDLSPIENKISEIETNITQLQQVAVQIGQSAANAQKIAQAAIQTRS